MTSIGTDLEAITLATIQRALENDWADGKRRYRLQTVMTGRVKRMREITGAADLPDLRRKDRATYERFLAGCNAAMNRDGLIEAGVLQPDELRAMKARALERENDAKWVDAAEDWRAGA
jgi:hypothetical protein